LAAVQFTANVIHSRLEDLWEHHMKYYT